MCSTNMAGDMEDNLIRRAQAGDQAAFRDLVEGYSSLVGRTARVLLADRVTAEDAAQEAWLDVWRNLARFEVGRPFRPWLVTVVANRCRMTARRRSLPNITLDDDSASQIAESARLTSNGLQGEFDLDLAQALTTLSQEQQRIVVLRFYAELELSEIATVLEVPLGTVKSRLHRALAALRLALDFEPPNELGTQRMEGELEWQI
jgi:RNA polymerase sigma factor (sigma-70 family)